MLTAQQTLAAKIAVLQAQQSALAAKQVGRTANKLGFAQYQQSTLAQGSAGQQAMALYYANKVAHLQAPQAPQGSASPAGQQSTGTSPAVGWPAFVAALPAGTYTVTQVLAQAGVVQAKGSKRVSCRAALQASPRATATQQGGPRSPYVFVVA